MITDPEVVRFCNERARPLADRLAQLYFASKSVLAEYAANSLDKKLTDGETVEDGSATDGRHPITGVDVKTAVALAQAYIDDFETGANAKLSSVLKVAVNPERA